MKRTISVISFILIISVLFASCGKNNIVTDANGNSYTMVMKHGEPVQDEYGNLVVKYKDETGKIVKSFIEYPDVTNAGKDGIQNAFISMKIPEGWKYDESVKAFRLQHDGECTKDGNFCEINVLTYNDDTLDNIYENKIAREKALNIMDSGNYDTEVKKFESNILGLKAKAFTCSRMEKTDVYCCVFSYKGMNFVINIALNKCCSKDFDYEGFINKYFSLKKIPTE